MKESSKVVYLEKNQPVHSPAVKAGQYGEVAGTCRGILFQVLNEAIKELFVQVDDDLYKLAENSTSNTQQTIFFDAMRSIRLMQKQLEAGYLQMIEDAYRSFWSGGTILSERVPEAGEEPALALVEKEALEEELAVSTMIDKTNDSCHRELTALNARFACLSGREDLSPEANPVSPAMLAMAFREVLSQWEAELLARIVVYKCFDRAVLSRMADCYEAMNRYLAEKGVLPELRHGVVSGPHPRGASPAGGTTTTGDAADTGSTETDAGQVPTLEQMWQYLQQLGSVSAIPALPLPVNPELPVMARADVMQALSRLQSEVSADRELEEMEVPLQQEFIRQQLVQVLGGGEEGHERHRVGEVEKRTIDMILALFNHVLDDPDLPDAMRALIGRLQIPVLKAAIVDSSFLHDDSHPARRLIDDLARASMGWRDDGDRGEKSLYHQVKQAVERIVHEYEEDIALFEEVRVEFGAWVAQRERIRKIMEERLAQAVSGEERLTVAKMKVGELLEQLEIDLLPEPARRILEGPWKKLLTILWLREGEEGQNTRKAVKIARLIEKYLAEGSVSFRREELLAEIPEIIGGLKKGFSYISLDRKKSARLLNGLQSCFIEVLRPLPSRPRVVVETDERQERKERVQEERCGEPEPEKAEPDEFDHKVAGIAEGTWIRLLPEREGEPPMICKLVWRSKYTGTMVFVDGQGNMAAQLKEEALAERFREGCAFLLEDAEAPLIDRAIRKMMRVLNAEIVGPRLKMAD